MKIYPDNADLDFEFENIEFAIREGMLEKLDDRIYCGRDGSTPELFVPIHCIDQKDSTAYFQRQQERLGLPHRLEDMYAIQVVAGPLCGSTDWPWHSRFGPKSIEFFYLQIQLAHGATGRNRFPYIPHFPCKGCFMYEIGFFLELAQLHDAVMEFRNRYTCMDLTTIPCFHTDHGGSKMHTRFANRKSLMDFIESLDRCQGEIVKRFRSEREFQRTLNIVKRLRANSR